jgi:DnaJ-class molecular chaperone
MEQDYYKILGVDESASHDEIKKVFRKAAKKFHPDRNPGNKRAEERFKKLSEAYDTLGDEKKRQEYDTMRKYGAFGGGFPGGPGGFPGGHAGPGRAGGQNPFEGFDLSDLMRGGKGGSFRSAGAGAGGMGGLEDILGSLFTSGGGGGPDPFGRPGQRQHAGPIPDTTTTISITFREAVDGTTKTLRLTGGHNTLRVRIPAGIDDGGKIRLGGQGQPGMHGGPNGDLIITVRVMPDQNFKRVGNDIHSSIDVSFVEAIKGCKKNVKTLSRTVSLTIPPGTQPGTKMRLKGMGLAVDGKSGDQYVEIKVTLPTELTDDQKRLLDEWEG